MASTSPSTPARWSRSWDRPGPARARSCTSSACCTPRTSTTAPRPELTFDGRDMVDLGDRERTRIRAREMGFVFQDFNLVPTLTAFENVMLACDYAGTNGADRTDRDARGARHRRARRPGRPPAVRALRRRAAAGRHRPRARQQASAGPRRRADRQPRFGAIRGGARAASAIQPRARADVHPGDPRQRGRRRLRPHRQDARRPDPRARAGRAARRAAMVERPMPVETGSLVGATPGG